MPTNWKCSHGFGLSEQCKECELDDAREVDHRFGKLVDAARAKIAEAEQTTEEQL